MYWANLTGNGAKPMNFLRPSILLAGLTALFLAAGYMLAGGVRAKGRWGRSSGTRLWG